MGIDASPQEREPNPWLLCSLALVLLCVYTGNHPGTSLWIFPLTAALGLAGMICALIAAARAKTCRGPRRPTQLAAAVLLALASTAIVILAAVLGLGVLSFSITMP